MSIFSTVLTVSLMASILAIVIVIADKLLNNYGECRIEVNQGTKVLKVTGGVTLLSALGSHQIYLPSACGGKATCGLCKVRLATEAGPILPTEEPYLSSQERDNGIRLSCQVKVKSDLAIAIPEELFNVLQYTARITKISQLTHDIKGFRLELIKPREISFKAGQYVQIDSKPYGDIKESVTRAYSIASLPSNKRVVELIVRLVPGGICTTYLHHHVHEGDEVTFRGPFGEFYLRPGADQLWFIAGGSGLAPIKSLVYDIIEKQLDKQMVFFFGAVTAKDLYYRELFESLDQENEHFSYVPALSNPAPSDNWSGETGLITEVVRRFGTGGPHKQAYLCGSPGMIEACVKVLGEFGFDQQSIFYDKF